jgi:phosphohistidine phosphatase
MKQLAFYLVQHGEAEPKSVDPARPLSGRGRQDVQRVAAFAAQMGLDVQQIRHSGKARAEQTAAILGQALSPPGGVVEAPGLAPNDDVGPVADELRRELQPVMLVGHLPFLARLAGLLLTGDPDRPVVQFCNAGIVCLTRGEGRWQVEWALTPEMAGV